jgi:aminomethyltransferase
MTTRRSPLHDWHLQHKARLVPFAGWDMPVQYTSIVEEHRAVRMKAGLFDVSHMARLSFSGADALKLLDLVCTNAIGTMKDGQVRYSLICNLSGGILDDVLVYRWPYGWAMVVNASNREKILKWLQTHILNQDVKIDDQTESTAMVAVQGPEAVAICKDLFRDDPSGLKYYHAMPTQFEGRNCVVSRTGYTGEDGFEIMLPAELGATIADRLVERGVLPCGLGARDTLRLEAAMPLYGHELNEQTDPFQAKLAWAVKLDKGDFLARESLQLLQSNLKRIRVGLKLEGKRAAREGSTIHVGTGKEHIGIVTSGSYVPHLEQSIAMAMIPPLYAEIGTVVEVDIRGSRTQATVVDFPFYRRKLNHGG